MLHSLLESQQGFLQCDVEVVIKVVTNALENSVLFLFQLKNDVRLDHIEHLFTLSFKFNDISGGHASFDINLELLSFLRQSLSLAVGAVLLVDFSFALACITGLLHLHLHEAHLDVLDSHALTIAFGTNFLLTALSS